jgi:outer membrane protein assembly factor BamB
MSTTSPDNPDQRVIAGAAAAVVAVASAAAFMLLVTWMVNDPTAALTVRLPIPGNRGVTTGGLVNIEGRFALLAPFSDQARSGEWPRFRGDLHNNISDEHLLSKWPEEGPPLLWEVDLGEGHAGAAVSGGRVYVLDYDEREQADMLRCFALADGRELWRRWYQTGAKRNHGISRTVPAVKDGFVVTMGPRCHIMCADAVTGEFKWGLDLVRDFGTEEPLWFTAQHPLIDNQMVVIAPAGDALMMAVDIRTGEVAWKAPNPGGWKMSHSSIVPMVFEGQKMYVYAALGGMAGVAADGPDAGSILWQTNEWNNTVMAPTPVPLDDGRLFVTAGYGTGSALFQVSRNGNTFSIENIRKFDRTVFACEQQTPVYSNGILWTVMPKDAGALRQQVVAMTPEGETLLTSGKEERFGLGPYMIVGENILVLNDNGVLTMAVARPGQWEVLARARVLDGRDAWAPMAMAGGLLILRDSNRMVCLDLAPRTETVDGGQI